MKMVGEELTLWYPKVDGAHGGGVSPHGGGVSPSRDPRAAAAHTLQTWVPCMAYELFGGKEAFEAAFARAQQDGVTLGSSS